MFAGSGAQVLISEIAARPRQLDCKMGWVTTFCLVPQQTYYCSKCERHKPRNAFHEANANDRQREVTSQCRDCRSGTYFERRYPGSICAQCLQHRPLDRNRICSACNGETGLRQCKVCRDLLPLYLLFYTGRRACKNCSKARRQRPQTTY